MEELTIGDKIYISSKRAAEITGYAKDYVGQLCREGRVEATLVGRSWYVLESSIKEHRFGQEADVSKRESKTESSSTAFDTWEKPSYSAEGLPELPAFQGSSVNVLNVTSEPEPLEAPEKPTQSIEEMQSAWKEWFATRNEPLLETEAVIEQREEVLEAEEEPEEVYDPVPATPEIEEVVEIHRTYDVPRRPEPVEVPVNVVDTPSREVDRPRKRRRQRGSSYLAVRALLISAAIGAVAIAVVGAGLLDSMLTKDGVQYEPVRFLGGTSILKVNK